MIPKALYWDEFADATINKLVRPERGGPRC